MVMKNQKELKQMYADILAAEVWKSSPDMVDFCVKKTAYIVELENGDIVDIEKPSIQKNFCFGYRLSRYDSEEYDSANDMAAHAAKSVDYFLEQNLKDINQMIERLEGKDSRIEFRIRTHYHGQPEDSKLKSINAFYWHDEEGKKFPKLEGENLQRVIEGYKEVKAAFEKRLNAYLKRYGLSKVNTWSYWQDA